MCLLTCKTKNCVSATPHALSLTLVLSCFLSSPDLDLVPILVLILHPTEPILPGTTEVDSEATTEVTGGPITTVGETEAFTRVAITRTGAEVVVMATRVIGKVVVVEAGMIAAMTKITILTAPGGGAHAHLRNAQVAGAGPAILTARLQGDLDAPDDLAIPLVLALHRRAITAAKANLALKMQS